MRLWVSTEVDDETCVKAMQRWMDTHAYHYPQLLQDALNGLFQSYDKRAVYVHIRGKKIELMQDCAICYEVADYQTPCGHHFHRRCLHRWLQATATCPMCRTQLNN